MFFLVVFVFGGFFGFGSVRGRPFEGVVVRVGELCFGLHGRRAPCNFFDGRRLRLEHLMAFFLYYYCPSARPCRVLDPTCGRKNYQFSGLKPRMYVEGVEYFDGDIEPYGLYQGDVFKLPFRDNCFDIIVYDPPYQVTLEHDGRVGDYATGLFGSLRDVRRFYSREVMCELSRVLVRGGVLIVKGSDFYYPKMSRNLVLFIPDILDPRNTPKNLRLEAVYHYSYYRESLRLHRVRTEHLKRPIIVTTQYAVFRKT